MKDSAEISGNTAPYGGGVEVGQLTFTMQGGKISGNKATAGSGGGVYVHGDLSGGTFVMTGGIIHGSSAGVETANTATGGGAALYKEADGVVKLNGVDQGTAERKWETTIQ